MDDLFADLPTTDARARASRPLIVSASYRTDIPATQGRWFLERLAEGSVEVPNPYGGAPARVSLRPSDVSGFVFWTRNAQPFLPALDEVRALGIPFIVQYSLTAYPKPLEPRVPRPREALAVMAALRARFGPKVVVWRYDPILFSSLTPPAVHRRHFAALARAAAGLTDEVVVSVFQPYRKAIRRLGAVEGLTWWDPSDDEKRALLAELAALAAERGLRLRVCAQPDLVVPGTTPAACVDVVRLSEVAGRAVVARARPHRQTCGCAESRDIGRYDTCAHGCSYCYATTAREGR
ncbi:DUF1848 domain-containing protein [Pararhodospirillum oryzae]|uniref:DNA repair photolyase n=1 Tax=Pararhodospirillum oryzae TaxID=478448 RepID=A0A512H7G2_9PROT|nr:DUF1848 domain-containing protein [Pararhodospirillum oryzae]GEO81368.1 hypothetical protein ROR02_14990 [Pararhodospirillum oryzae]